MKTSKNKDIIKKLALGQLTATQLQLLHKNLITLLIGVHFGGVVTCEDKTYTLSEWEDFKASLPKNTFAVTVYDTGIPVATSEKDVNLC